MKIKKTQAVKKISYNYSDYNTMPNFMPRDRPDNQPDILFKDKGESKDAIKKKWKSKKQQEGVTYKNIYQEGIKVPVVDIEHEIPHCPV